jgi:hypothetical protein
MDFESKILSLLESISSRLDAIEERLRENKSFRTPQLNSYADGTLKKMTLYPSKSEIKKHVSDYIQTHGLVKSEKQLHIDVRKWFRKRREYMTHRINTVCHNQLKLGRQTFVTFCQTILEDDAECIRWASECRIEAESEQEGLEFFRKKVHLFSKRQHISDDAEQT